MGHAQYGFVLALLEYAQHQVARREHVSVRSGRIYYLCATIETK